MVECVDFVLHRWQQAAYDYYGEITDDPVCDRCGVLMELHPLPPPTPERLRLENMLRPWLEQILLSDKKRTHERALTADTLDLAPLAAYVRGRLLDQDRSVVAMIDEGLI